MEELKKEKEVFKETVIPEWIKAYITKYQKQELQD